VNSKMVRWMARVRLLILMGIREWEFGETGNQLISFK